MQKEKVMINVNLSKDLLEKIKNKANEKELSTNAVIRLILQAYFENNQKNII